MYLERALEERAALCAASGGGVVLLHVDLDGFKQINDTLGHPAGDAMLVHTAETIRRVLHEGDFVARTGGDEFVVVCNAEESVDGFDELARKIIETFASPSATRATSVGLGLEHRHRRRLRRRRRSATPARQRGSCALSRQEPGPKSI